MTSFQTAMGNVGTYFERLAKGKRIDTGEMTQPVAQRKSTFLTEVDRKKEIKRLKGLAGELQRAETYKISDIETNFYKDMLTSLQQKQNQARTEYEAAASKFAALSDMYINDPSTAAWGREREAMKTPQGIIDLFKERREMADNRYRSAGRFLRAHADNPDSPLWQALLAAGSMSTQDSFQKYYGTRIAETQTSLSEATLSAMQQAEENAVVLNELRDTTISDIQQAIKTRTQRPSNELLTETQQGPARKQGITFTKNNKEKVMEPSLFAERPL